jgi:hypothetical protein
MNLTTPSSIDDSVSEFCSEISAGTQPVYLDLTPTDGCKLADCFNNVLRHCDINGGTTQHGWIIWYSEGFFIEAEFHGVWRTESGDLVDITPKVDGEERILFLPDSELTWNKTFVANRRKGLMDNPLVKITIDQGHALDQLKMKYCDENGRLQMPQHVMAAHRQETMAKTMAAMQGGMPTFTMPTTQSQTSKNSKCPCGSGRKIKHCKMKGRCNGR